MCIILQDDISYPKYTGKLSLTRGIEYSVIGIEADHYRLLDDDGSPVLNLITYFVQSMMQFPQTGSWKSAMGVKSMLILPSFIVQDFLKTILTAMKEPKRYFGVSYQKDKTALCINFQDHSECAVPNGLDDIGHVLAMRMSWPRRGGGM